MAFFSAPLDQLPHLDDAAAEHAVAVCESLKALVADAPDGFLPFDEYMQHILYAPGLGYYSAGSLKFGAAGDFVTAPLMTSLFSQTLAQYILNHRQGADSILEIGAGNGQMAVDILLFLQAEHALPEHYYILEASGDLRQRQQVLMKQQLCQEVFSRVQWLGSLPPQGSFQGMIIGNEVMDAMPVKRFVLEKGGVSELGVTWEGDGLIWQSTAADSKLAEYIRQHLPGDLQDYPDGYIFEVNLMLAGWIKELSDCLYQGQILMLDYGYERAEYYRSDRTGGTIRGYFRQYAVDDVLLYPGLMDVTAWVDFTGIAESAQTVGLNVSGYTTQGNFLLDVGLLQLADSGLDDQTSTQYLTQVEQIKTLLEPGEMGENVKVIALTKSCDINSGFTRDMRYRL